MKTRDIRKIANGLGWFSVALGVTELFAARRLARAFGLGGGALLRVFGLREIGSGVGLLMQKRKGPWVWARIAGDALDVATLASRLGSRRKRRNAALAIAAVAPVVALDIFAGQQLGFQD
jgi:hypothetical protein